MKRKTEYWRRNEADGISLHASKERIGHTWSIRLYDEVIESGSAPTSQLAIMDVKSRYEALMTELESEF